MPPTAPATAPTPKLNAPRTASQPRKTAVDTTKPAMSAAWCMAHSGRHGDLPEFEMDSSLRFFA